MAGQLITPRHPVESIDWSLAVEVLADHGLELPTLAQWGYARDAGSTSPWPPDGVPRHGVANLADVNYRKLHTKSPVEAWDDGYACHAPIGSFAPNGFGLHDMVGNVREWLRDTFSDPLRARAGDGYNEPRPDAPDRGIAGGSFGDPEWRAMLPFESATDPESRAQWNGVRALRRVRFPR